PVEVLGGAQALAAQTDQGEQACGEQVTGAALVVRVVAVLAPDRQEQALQAVVEQVEEVAGGVAVRAIAEGLLAVEGRQRRAGTEQADQVDAQARAQLAVFLEELQAIRVAAGEAQAGVGLELQALVQRLLIQLGMGGAQAFQYPQYALKEAVFADAGAELAQSRGCCPMRGVHWYTSPCVLLTRSSW